MKQKIHFIAIGGAAMHNLAIALHKKGLLVSGSDDEIFEPSKSRLAKHGLLPDEFGWFPEKISTELDAVILGMHARIDNPELNRAQELGVKVYSYPEFLYEQTKNKKRVVIGGSHGKTTTTSMVMHVLKESGLKFDYMVGANIEGFDTMVNLESDSGVAVFEGDEYLSSPIDRRPKFHLYKPHVAVLTGVAWDHINVFPTFENYVEQFKLFVETLEGGKAFYFSGDEELNKLAQEYKNMIPYAGFETERCGEELLLKYSGERCELSVFGEHNLQNMKAAYLLCKEIGVSDKRFFNAISSFKGAAKRLQLLKKNDHSRVYLDFAHSPSKVKATVKAVREMFPEKKLIACLELHTFSSLNKDFLSEYDGSLKTADERVVFFNPKTVAHKRLEEILENDVKAGFNDGSMMVEISGKNLEMTLTQKELNDSVLLLMSSGDFAGIELGEMANKIIR